MYLKLKNYKYNFKNFTKKRAKKSKKEQKRATAYFLVKIKLV